MIEAFLHSRWRSVEPVGLVLRAYRSSSSWREVPVSLLQSVTNDSACTLIRIIRRAVSVAQAGTFFSYMRYPLQLLARQ
jgi:hypothetical protein